MTRSRLSRLPLLLAALLLPALVSAFWRLPCSKPISIERADPIVSPGKVASHVHTIMGASAFNAYATGDTIRDSHCSTCRVNEDMSNYWIQTLFYQHSNGTFESVAQVGGMLVYYLQRPAFSGEKIWAFPDQMRILAGDPHKVAADGSIGEKGISYKCLDYSTNIPETHAFPQRNCPNGLRVQVFFPMCWDGVNSDSADHKSHMAYPSQFNSGTCPATHPKKTIALFFEIVYSTSKYAGDWLDANGKPKRAMPFFWSTGDNRGFGHHGDFLNGWNSTVLQRATDTCLASSGVVEECGAFTFRSDASSCKPEYAPASDGVVTGLLATIPGLAPVPVGAFNPCGYSPAAGHDNTVASAPLGTCTGAFTGLPAYTPQTPVVNDALGGSTATLQRNPPPYPPEGYLGCWKDNTNNIRIMEYRLATSGSTATSCRALAKATSASLVVFALEFGGECWASTSNTRYSSQGPSTACTTTCTANQYEFCGGNSAAQVYTVNTAAATGAPTAAPVTTAAPTTAPIITAAPTVAPIITAAPTVAPIVTAAPTVAPVLTLAPTAAPPLVTASPTTAPVITAAPTAAPNLALPTLVPTVVNTPAPTFKLPPGRIRPRPSGGHGGKPQPLSFAG